MLLITKKVYTFNELIDNILNMKSENQAGRVLRRVRHSVSFKNEKFDVVCHCYDSASLPEKVEGINLKQAESLYRQKYGLPFPEEVTMLRERYGLTSHRLSEILAMGPNTIKKYERGEIPAPALGHMILSLYDDHVFAFYLDLAHDSDRLGDREYESLKRHAVETVASDPCLRVRAFLSSLCPVYERPCDLNGFRYLDFNRLTAVVSYLGSRMRLTVESLARILFYVDFAHYRLTCRSVTGLAYEATPDCGMRAYQWDTVLGLLSVLRMVCVHESCSKESGYTAGIESVCSIVADEFSDTEKAVLDEAVKFFGDKKPAEVIAYSMKETLWTKNHDTPDVVSYQPNAFLYEWMA